jgi:hypothetical protein
VLGAEHPTPWTLAATSPLGPGRRGDPAAVRDQFAALLPGQRAVIGAEHPDTLTTRSNLAYWTKRADSHADNDDHPDS